MQTDFIFRCIMQYSIAVFTSEELARFRLSCTALRYKWVVDCAVYTQHTTDKH